MRQTPLHIFRQNVYFVKKETSVEYFDDIRFHICRKRFLPLNEKMFYPDTHSVEFIKNGLFILQHGKRCYELSGPVFFWMKRSEPYCLNQKDPQHKKIEHFYCDCYGERTERMIRFLDSLFPEGFFFPGDPLQTEEIFQQQIQLYQEDKITNHGLLAINLDRLMFLALRSHSTNRTFRQEDPYGIRFLAGEIRKNPFAEFDFQGYAARKGITYIHFRRLFCSVHNSPPTEYLRNQKMVRACELLRMTDLRIKQIADHCHYNSLMDFSRTFKKYAGVSPSAYRLGQEKESKQI